MDCGEVGKKYHVDIKIIRTRICGINIEEQKSIWKCNLIFILTITHMQLFEPVIIIHIVQKNIEESLIIP